MQDLPVDVRVRHSRRRALKHPCAFSVLNRLPKPLERVQDDAFWSVAYHHRKLNSEAAGDRDIRVGAVTALGVRLARKVAGVHARLANDDIYLPNLGRIYGAHPLLALHTVLNPLQLKDLGGNRGHVKGHHHRDA